MATTVCRYLCCTMPGVAPWPNHSTVVRLPVLRCPPGAVQPANTLPGGCAHPGYCPPCRGTAARARYTARRYGAGSLPAVLANTAVALHRAPWHCPVCRVGYLQGWGMGPVDHVEQSEWVQAGACGQCQQGVR